MNRPCFDNVQSKIKGAWKNLDQIQSLDMYIIPLRHERMYKWLNLDFTHGMIVSKGRRSVG